MTSKEIIDLVAEKTGATKKTVKDFADTFELATKELLSSIEVGEKIKLMDITMRKKDVRERNGVNPQTFEKIVIPATKKIEVKISADIKRIAKEK